MKIIVQTFVLILISFCGLSQDLIYFKNNTIQRGKIIEVNVDKIRFQKQEVPNGPIYESLKTEIIKIQYSNGYIDYIETVDESNTKNRKDSYTNSIIKFDSTSTSEIYILFNYGMDESQSFPIFFNEQYVCTLKNHMRLKYAMHSSGQLIIERRGRNAYKKGPKTIIMIEPNRKYGINIELPHPQALDPNKRFNYQVFCDSIQVNNFIKNQFYGFEPFKNCEIILSEQITNPLIK